MYYIIYTKQHLRIKLMLTGMPKIIESKKRNPYDLSSSYNIRVKKSHEAI